MVDFPYPTFVEIIRACAKVLGIKGADKEMDDRALDKTIDPRKIRDFKKALVDKLGTYADEQSKDVCKTHLEDFFSNYVQLIARTPADGLTRAEMNRLLAATLGRDAVLKIVNTLLAEYMDDSPSTFLFFSSPGNATSSLLIWLTENKEIWKVFTSRLNKENKAKVKAWQNGEHLPDTMTISLLTTWAGNTTVETASLAKIQLLLFISAAVDRLSKESVGALIIEECRLVLFGMSATFTLNDNIADLQTRYRTGKQDLLPLIGFLQHKLMRTVEKEEGEKGKLASMLQELANHSQKDYHFDYRINWLTARYFVYDGSLDEATHAYKDAFRGGLYRAGFQQQKIIEEAVVVASSLASPDKVFLKQLKFASLTFNYDIPSVQVKTASNKITDVIEDWEIDNWRSSFHTIFPESGLFESGRKQRVEKNIGPMILSQDELEKHQPDFRYPNRKIKIGHGQIKKTWPQLALFVWLNKVDVVKKLLDKGAKVDSLSSSNESALLIALGKLDVTAIPFESMDDRCFRLLAECQHKVETVNKLSSKRKLLPLIEAVKSGRLEIVNTLINMGADVNQRGDTDLQTPLNVCIKIIGMLKDPEKYIKQQLNMPITPEALDSIRRFNPGMTGFTLEHQRQNLGWFRSIPELQKCYEMLLRKRSCFVNKHASLHNLRTIAATLIDEGADVNAVHTSPLNGYTPLMFAVELDEVELVKKMLTHGGELRRSYRNENICQYVDCFTIASAFQSRQVLRFFEDIRRYF